VFSEMRLGTMPSAVVMEVPSGRWRLKRPVLSVAITVSRVFPLISVPTTVSFPRMSTITKLYVLPPTGMSTSR